MAVFRVEKNRNYTVMSNYHLRDKNLSLKASGLLSKMLSLTEEWNYTTRGLASICKEGVDAIGSTLRELEANGYLIRTQLRDAKGRISDTEYVIYEQPHTPLPCTTPPDTEKPDMDAPETEPPYPKKPAQLNIDIRNPEKSKTDLFTTDISNPYPSNPPAPYGTPFATTGWDEMGYLRFESLAAVTAAGQAVERKNYEPVYTDSFIKFEGTRDRLEDLFDRFNNDRPADFHGHSLSVSDIIALKQSGQVSYHYVDSFDFAPLPDFKKPENYLKNAEMAMEDDYGMIDGIVNNGVKQPTVAELEQQAKSGTPISLMDLAAASHRERAADRKEKRPSVLAQLKSYQEKEKPNIAPKKSAERDL